MNKTTSITNELKYDHLIGTGGIGSGIFFSFHDSHTLGRNESRLAKLESFKDYCKQHIILHYISVLLGSGKGSFKTFPIGAVGKDEMGRQLIDMMGMTGMDTTFVSVNETKRTMFSVCYQYPDFSGGNITTENSACSEVSENDIVRFFKDYRENGKKALILAAPEVPMEPRIKLLEIGRKNKSCNIACVLSSEVTEFHEMGGFRFTDILAINSDEVMTIAGQSAQSDFRKIFLKCVDTLMKENNSLTILATDGKNGCYCYLNGQVEFTPALKTKTVSTAGAGDAFLSGTMIGLCYGLPFLRGFDVENLVSLPLSTAVEFGTLLASMTVTSPDTIHHGITVKTLKAYAKDHNLKFADTFARVFSKITL